MIKTQSLSSGFAFFYVFSLFLGKAKNVQQLINYIKQFTPLDQEVVDELTIKLQVEFFRKNEFLLEEGRYCNHLWFLQKGMVRKYHISDGDEITTWIHCEGEVITSMPAYIDQTLSDEYLQLCEDSEIIAVPRSYSESLSRYPQMEVFAKKLIETSMVALVCIGKQFNRMSAREKYETLIKQSPEMMKRAKLVHIASIMGVSPETLSRIRAVK